MKIDIVKLKCFSILMILLLNHGCSSKTTQFVEIAAIKDKNQCKVTVIREFVGLGSAASPYLVDVGGDVYTSNGIFDKKRFFVSYYVDINDSKLWEITNVDIAYNNKYISKNNKYKSISSAFDHWFVMPKNKDIEGVRYRFGKLSKNGLEVDSRIFILKNDNARKGMFEVNEDYYYIEQNATVSIDIENSSDNDKNSINVDGGNIVKIKNSFALYTELGQIGFEKGITWVRNPGILHIGTLTLDKGYCIISDPINLKAGYEYVIGYELEVGRLNAKIISEKPMQI